MDIVLGVSMAPSSIQMVVLEGECADGAIVEEDVFDVAAAGDTAPASASHQVISAILGTREGATDAGLEVSSIGVACTDQFEAAALRDALAAHRIDNVMLVSAFLAAAALAQNIGGAMGYERTAVLFVEPDTATLAIVETSDGSIPDVYTQQIEAESYGEAAEQLSAMVSGMEKLELLPGGLFLVGSGIDITPLRPTLQATTFLDVSVAEEPETALARGAALASANAPLFASSTAALAYAQDAGTGVVGQHSLPEYLYVPDGAEPVDDDLAYSLVGDEDAESPTVVIEKLFLPEEPQPRRRPVLLVGSGLAVVGISAVLALEIALAIGIRNTGTVALQPTPGQHLIVPAQQAPAPAPVLASAPQPKISLPAPMAAPKPLLPPVAAPLPVPAAPVAPVPVVVPPVPVPVPIPMPVHIPLPNPVVSPPPIADLPRLSAPQPVLSQPPMHIPQPQSPPYGTYPGQGISPRPNGPGGPGGYPGGHAPLPGEGGPGGYGGGHAPLPGEGGPGGFGGGHAPLPGAGGPGGYPGGHAPLPGEGGPGGYGGGHAPTPGAGGGQPGGPGLFGGGGHGGGGPFGGGGPSGGGFGGGPPGGFGGGPSGGFGGGHSGGGFGGGPSGGGGFGGGHGGGGGFGGGPSGGGGFSGGGGGHSGGGGGGHH